MYRQINLKKKTGEEITVHLKLKTNTFWGDKIFGHIQTNNRALCT